jgi:glycosyltransferase involved in cell wall biosynthesis
LAAVASTDATIVVSTHEEAILHSLVPDARVHVVPLLFDIPERLETTGPDNRYDIMFVGTYQHPPNPDAAIWFAREIWPLVRPRLPEARFLLVGSSITPEVQALAGNGVEVLGFVEDLNAILATCRLTVAPLRFGAGLKGKVASSQLAGVPVVATPIAVEGTAMRHGVEVMIADDPRSFADAVVKVYQDPVLWRQLATEGFRFVRREYAIDANVDRVRAVLEDAGVTMPTPGRAMAATEGALAAGTETPGSAACPGAARGSPTNPPGVRPASPTDSPIPVQITGPAMRLSHVFD